MIKKMNEDPIVIPMDPSVWVIPIGLLVVLAVVVLAALTSLG